MRKTELGEREVEAENMTGVLSEATVKSRRRRFAEAGQAIVEMAFILPLFLCMVFAIFEFGRAWAVKHALTIAAREGARVLVLPYGGGLTYSSETEVQTAARERAISYLNNSTVPVGTATQINIVRVRPGGDNTYGTADDVIEQNYTDGKRGDRVGIQITHNHDTALPLILFMFNNTNSQNGIVMGVTAYMDHE
jgi:Flp pilus assembly protein TadG